MLVALWDKRGGRKPPHLQFYCECGEHLLIIYPRLVHRSWLGSVANVVGPVGKSLEPESHVRHRCQDFFFLSFFSFSFFLSCMWTGRPEQPGLVFVFFMAVITGSLQSGGFLPSALKRHFPRLLEGSWFIARSSWPKKRDKKTKTHKTNKKPPAAGISRCNNWFIYPLITPKKVCCCFGVRYVLFQKQVNVLQLFLIWRW